MEGNLRFYPKAIKTLSVITSIGDKKNRILATKRL